MNQHKYSMVDDKMELQSSGYFKTSIEHIFSELKRIDVLVQIAISKSRSIYHSNDQFRGLIFLMKKLISVWLNQLVCRGGVIVITMKVMCLKWLYIMISKLIIVILLNKAEKEISSCDLSY